MNDLLQQFREAADRAVDFQLQHQQPDGSFIWDPEIPDAYHKQTWSWALAGHLAEAHSLLNWIRDNTLRADGSVDGYRGDVYKLSWLSHGSHRVGRFDLAHPIIGYVLAQQVECGGFPHFAGDDRLRCLPTAWAGVAAVRVGRLDVAERAGRWCLRLLDQPNEDRYYFRTTLDGSLVTDEIEPDALFIDLTEPKQPYWEIGLPWLLCNSLYQATGRQQWLDRATDFFDLHLRCAEDRFSHTGSGKSSLAAATHCVVTGDERARDAALTFGRFLLENQREDGSWTVGGSDDLLTRIDAAAEFSVWLGEMSGLLGHREGGRQCNAAPPND